MSVVGRDSAMSGRASSAEITKMPSHPASAGRTATCEAATRAASMPAARLAGVPVQEAQSLLIELSCALVNSSMCASLEH